MLDNCLLDSIKIEQKEEREVEKEGKWVKEPDCRHWHPEREILGVCALWGSEIKETKADKKHRPGYLPAPIPVPSLCTSYPELISVCFEISYSTCKLTIFKNHLLLREKDCTTIFFSEMEISIHLPFSVSGLTEEDSCRLSGMVLGQYAIDYFLSI